MRRLPSVLNMVLCLSALAAAAQSQTSGPGANAPAVSWRAVVAAEREKLGGPWQVRPHRKLGDETPLSRECYKRLLKYVRLTEPGFHDWPAADGCRFHKRDDHSEHGVRQNTVVALGYSVLLAGDYDASIAGVPRDKITSDLVSLLRYIAITHVANFLPTGDGHPWGDHWQSAYWTSMAGHAAWLAWDLLDDDLKVMVVRMVAHEADRFNTRQPDSGEANDTKSEENAWNSEVIALADCMLPRHPNASLWHERAIVWMINSFSRDADKGDMRAVDGLPAKDRITAANVHPDYTLENHGRVHPDYLCCTDLLLRNVMLYEGAGLPSPESCFYNVPETYAVIKRLTAAGGALFYINGQDWWIHQPNIPLVLTAVMSVARKDADAACIEQAALDSLAQMHARFDNGSAWQPCEYNYPNAEEEMIDCYSELWLLHRLLGDGPPPAARVEFTGRQCGVKAYDAGGFVTHRTPEKFVSFAWVNGAMGLVYPSDTPKDSTWFTAPFERGMVGEIVCEGVSDSAPVVEEHRIETQQDSFAVSARISRCNDKVGQTVVVVSLPGAPVVYIERLTAREPVTVKEIATGSAGILNEDAPGISPNHRVLHNPKGSEVIPGACSEPERLLRFDTPWVNVDNRLGVITSSGAVAYRDVNAYAHSRLEEVLIANHKADIGPVAAGAHIDTSAVVFMPNQTHDATAETRLEFVQVGASIAAVRVHGTIIAANLGAEAAQGEVFGVPNIALETLQVKIIKP